MTIARWIPLRMRNVPDEGCREDRNRHFVCSNVFRKSCRLWDNVEKYCRAGQATDDNIIWRLRTACWITKAINTHSQYVILIIYYCLIPLSFSICSFPLYLPFFSLSLVSGSKFPPLFTRSFVFSFILPYLSHYFAFIYIPSAIQYQQIAFAYYGCGENEDSDME